MRIATIILGLFIMLSQFVSAQPAGAQTEVINGRTYYVHVVEKGNTLFGIHQLYNVPVEDILNANEGLTNELSIGQKIYIPAGNVQQSEGTTEHTVAPGETLYGISKKYKCSVADLKKLNPGIGEGISVGQVIKVPGGQGMTEYIPTDPVENQDKVDYSISFEDSIVNHTVLEHETLYSISKRYMVSMDTIMAVNGLHNTKVKKGDVVRIPLKKVNYEIVQKDINSLGSPDTLRSIKGDVVKKQVYRVALMLPLMLDKNEEEMNKILKPGQERELFSTTKFTYAFYQGFMYAADSLKKAGLNVNIYVYDTKRDTNTMAKYFAQPEFREMDLVIGPLYENTIRYATKVCKEKKIRVILPFKVSTQFMYKNPYVYNCVTSNMTLIDGMVDYIVDNMNQYNIILLKPYSESDKALYERARDRYNTLIKNKPGAMNAKILELDLGSSGGRELNAQVLKDTTNVFIVPSDNVKFVSGALNRMNKVMNMNPYAKNLKIIAFGFEDWNSFDDLDILHRNRLYQHYVSYRYVDYNKGRGLEFVKAFRSKYGIDPNVYSTQGFDIGYYFLSALHLYGVNLEPYLSVHNVPLIQNAFDFEQTDAGSGMENKRSCIVMYNDYTLKRVH